MEGYIFETNKDTICFEPDGILFFLTGYILNYSIILTLNHPTFVAVGIIHETIPTNRLTKS